MLSVIARVGTLYYYIINEIILYFIINKSVEKVKIKMYVGTIFQK